MLLSDLNFRDIYIQIGEGTNINTPSRYHKKPQIGDNNTFGNFQIPTEFNERIDELRGILLSSKKNNFAINFDGMRMRVVRYPVVNGQMWTCLRRIGVKLPILNELNFENGMVDIFKSWGKRAGLIIIGGSTGSGKTTTAVGMLNEWMNSFGGTLYTIEDPVEYIMQGVMGVNGFVIQREVEDDDQWAEDIKDALRSAPNYIFVGEVRDAKAARQLLRAATSGHTVLCTVHGSSVSESLSAIVQNAEQELGDMAYNLLAEGLTGVIYQNIVRGKPIVEIVETLDSKNGGVDNVRQNIRGKKLNMLNSEIERQKALRLKKREREEEREDEEGGSKGSVPKSQEIKRPVSRPQSRPQSPVQNSSPKTVVKNKEEQKKGVFGFFGKEK